MKPRRSSFWPGEGFSGYVAAIECRRAHVPRPRASTSGGQSLAGAGGFVVLFRAAFVWVAQLEKALLEEQDRHLINQSPVSKTDRPRNGVRDKAKGGGTHGFPSLPKTTPLGSGVGGSSLAAGLVTCSLSAMLACVTAVE